MMAETEEILHRRIDFLPLRRYAHIVRANALRMDWNSLLGQDERFDYILGNPPFIGARNKSPEQAADVGAVFAGWKNAGNLDYVACWYGKAAELMRGTRTRCAFVSTNSVCQGESVALLWKPLFAMGAEIDFAWRTFVWDSEANEKAHVHVVIVGFHVKECGNDQSERVIASSSPSRLFPDDGQTIFARHINGYLMDGPDVFVESRKVPLCDVPLIGIGNKPIDGGHYLFTKEEKDIFIANEPASEKYFHLFLGAEEYINGKDRYCLWLGECSPGELRRMPSCLKRVELVRKYRLASTSLPTRKLAERPTRFHIENLPKAEYIVIPEVSSQRRSYVPMGYLTPSTMCSNKLRLMPNATLFHFGVLNSSVHMAWMRVVCGRLKSDYSYSVNIVYNNFPWPNCLRRLTQSPQSEQKGAKPLRRFVDSALAPEESGVDVKADAFEDRGGLIAATARAILDARALYPDSSLADLYDPLTMPSELRRAHRANDQAVLAAYGFAKDATEEEIVAKLFEMYAELTSDNEK